MSGEFQLTFYCGYKVECSADPPSAWKDAIEEHVASCPKCQAAKHRNIFSDVSLVRKPELPPGMAFFPPIR
jgi:hypothetical protein